MITKNSIDYYDTQDASSFLGYKPSYIYQLVAKGKLVYQMKIGVSKFFTLEYLKTCKRNGRASQ